MKKKLLLLISLFLIMDLLRAQEGKEWEDALNGQTYKTFQVGSQIWMAQNLNSSKFANGDLIPQAKNMNEWIEAGKNRKPVWCFYEFDSKNGNEKYYNWYALIDQRGLAPKGWHIPDEQEWDELISNLGDEYSAGSKMKSSDGWHQGGNGDNQSGFNGEPFGFIFFSGFFGFKSTHGFWWINKEVGEEQALVLQLLFDNNSAGKYPFEKKGGHSVRCIKD